MTACAYCERPLICEACGTEYLPPSQEHYEALSQRDRALDCPACGKVLICHWCKTAYDGLDQQDEGDAGH
jgi:hypothetical protein